MKIDDWRIDLSDSIRYACGRMDPLTGEHFSFKCPMNWDDMEISGSGRHCGKCQKQVYDLTNCSVDDVIALQKKHGPICGSISVAVVALSLATAACENANSRRTTGVPLPQPAPAPAEVSQIPGQIYPPDLLGVVKQQAPISNGNRPIRGKICSPEQLEKMKQQERSSAGE